MTAESPYTREQLLQAFGQQETESVAYWEAFDTGAFFRRIGSSWSPAETVRHLNKSTRPLVKALGMPKLVLRFMFERWPEQKLDELQLPHPLLGKLTVREMPFFTLYHQRHHMNAVERRLREAGAGE